MASGSVSRAVTAGRAQASALYQVAYYLGASAGGTAGAALYRHAEWPGLVGFARAQGVDLVVVGPEAPLTLGLADACAARWGDRVMVDFCMRYGNPSTESVLTRMVRAGCDRIVFLPLYPQYAGATTATANDQLFRALMKQFRQPAVRTVTEYFERPGYIDALAQSVERTLDGHRPQKLVCSYHGMPRRYLMQGDPYHCQCQKTTRLLRDRLGWAEDAIDTSFQSVFGREEWLKPYTVEHVAALARDGITDIAVISPAFATDCIETLEEINGEIRHAFEEAGGKRFTYVPCLNDDDAHIAMLTDLVAENLTGWVG